MRTNGFQRGVKAYQKRIFLRKGFDKEDWVQEPALRQIQDTIALGFFIAAALTVVFLCVPNFCSPDHHHHKRQICGGYLSFAAHWMLFLFYVCLIY